MAQISVSSFLELKSAIEDSINDDIIVTSDITFEGGIKVNISKSNIIIDCNNCTITDNNNTSFTSTIYLPSTTNTISITVKNAIWKGRNYYGVVAVTDGNVNSSITLDNINYIGPQFVYNRSGITNINNCTVTIDKNGASSTAQEFCEGNRINISGNVKVVSNSTSDAIIWFINSGASLTIEENANFDVNASSTYFLYTDHSPILLFKKNSFTKIITKSGLFYASGSSTHIASSFTLEEGASFIAYKQVGNTIPLFKCLSSFTLQKNSTFKLFSEVISSTPLMYFGQTASVNFNSPKSVVLYNRGGDVFSFQSGSSSNPNVINITSEMLRLWDVAKYPIEDAGTLDNAPNSEYYKKSYSENINLTIKTSSSQVIGVESNLENEDVGYPLSTSIKILTSKVLSMGELKLIVDEINDKSSAIDGSVEPNATVKIEYGDTSSSIVSDENGNFSFPIENPISVNTNVKISTNKDFLTKTITILSLGTLSVTSLPKLDFNPFTKVIQENIIYRKISDWTIRVTDTRNQKGNWFLYAHILSPFSYEENQLEDALILKQGDNISIVNETPLLIYASTQNNEITDIVWNKDEGFLLKLNTNITYVAGNYKTNLFWELTTEEK